MTEEAARDTTIGLGGHDGMAIRTSRHAPYK